MDWLEFLSFLLSPLELGDSEPVVVYGTDYLQQVSELINRTEPRWEESKVKGWDSGLCGDLWQGPGRSLEGPKPSKYQMRMSSGQGFRVPFVTSIPTPCSKLTSQGETGTPGQLPYVPLRTPAACTFLGTG
jgi:hypothetical protein